MMSTRSLGRLVPDKVGDVHDADNVDSINDAHEALWGQLAYADIQHTDMNVSTAIAKATTDATDTWSGNCRVGF